jgi:hypothetical protein
MEASGIPNFLCTLTSEMAGSSFRECWCCLNDHPMRDILDYFGNPGCTIVLPQRRPSHPQALPAYLVPPISIMEYMTPKDPALHEASLRAEIIDLGNGQYSNRVNIVSIGMITICSHPRRRAVASFLHPSGSLRAWAHI